MRVSFVVLGLVVAACASTTRAPSSAGVEHDDARDAGAANDEEAAAEDSDGETEASSELAIVTEPSPCPTNMVLVATGELRFCVDKYEASLVEVDADGSEKPFPHWLAVDGHAVRAVSEPDVFPQGFISEVQAEDACAASGKRLCSYGEWKAACMGPAKTTFPYGDARRPGACHDTGKSAVGAVFGTRALTDPVPGALPSKPAPVNASSKGTASSSRGASTAAGSSKSTKASRQAHVTTKGRAAETTRPRAARPAGSAKSDKPSKRTTDKGTTRDKSEKAAARGTKRITAKTSTRPASVEASVWTQLNDPRLGRVEGALAKTGAHDTCVNGYGVLDMVGNLHEWVKTDPAGAHGTFAGGYYLDTALNGDGCQYRTTAHAHDYHDYSTGFRCCAEPKAEPATSSAN
jgi:hypothetical protein